MNIGHSALKFGDAALKVGEGKLKVGDAASSTATCAQSAIFAAVAFFAISTLQPISKYLVFTAVTGAALLPLPAFWRFLKEVLRSVSAIIKVCYRFLCDIRSLFYSLHQQVLRPVPVQQVPVTESRSSTAAVEEVGLTQRVPAQGSGPSEGSKS